ARFLDKTNAVLDEGLALFFPAPHSYTGENVLELHGHGGPVVLNLLLARCLEAGRAIGLRVAEPGEFTRRAFLNERLDLAQAEAVADLIDAATEAAARSATRSLEGEFSRAVTALADGLVELRTLVEATLDFPDEEIDFLQAADAHGKLAALRARLDEVLARARQGALLRAGLAVVLVGSPNVGKSSLLNALAGADVAIVTAQPGTTRDRVESRIQIAGIPLNIIDTAGVRETTDEVERIGIERTLAAVERADVVLHIVDVTQPAGDEAVLARIRARLPRGAALFTVFNKIDLTAMAPHREEGDAGAHIHLSAKTGAGIDTLRAALLQAAGWADAATGETVFLARERHLQALYAASAHLDAALEHAALGNRALELLAEELRLAADRLGTITGAVSADDLLGRIFSRFCIGK
ncbi:MAG TPA: tRNA uridine-5-carboxymethylaminomethyl(34) synthesis GTPase MnmE, partial [Burkholderiaceae bacterium]|nr:tRNA uridine-5-carboxymethylaminomethyl(34) synthesis GTPase MnmE [Burkholderiaceae bacterium]